MVPRLQLFGKLLVDALAHRDAERRARQPALKARLAAP